MRPVLAAAACTPSATSEIDAQSELGEIYLRTLLRAQLRLALSILLCSQANLLLNSAYHLAAFGSAYWLSGRILRKMGLENRRWA